METKAETSSLSDAQDRALKHWESANRFFRNTIKEVWECGRALCEVKKELPHGKWGEWLKSAGIPTSTAHRWMKLSEQYDEISQIGKFNSVDQALKAWQPARSKRKEPAKKFEPEVETEGESSSVQQEEVTDGDGTLQVPDHTESAQEIQELPDKLSETEDQRPVGEKETSELREIKDQLREAEKKNTDLRQENADLRQENTDLRQENDRLKRQLEEKGTPKETTSVDQGQIYPHSAFSGNSENPGSGGARTTAVPESGETPTLQHPETRTAIPVSEGK